MKEESTISSAVQTLLGDHRHRHLKIRQAAAAVEHAGTATLGSEQEPETRRDWLVEIDLATFDEEMQRVAMNVLVQLALVPRNR